MHAVIAFQRIGGLVWIKERNSFTYHSVHVSSESFVTSCGKFMVGLVYCSIVKTLESFFSNAG